MLNLHQHKKIIIMGLGLHGGGVSSAAFFARTGARVLVTDHRSADQLKPSIKKLKKINNIKFILGRHRKIDFKRADLIIRNPAVPNNSEYLEIARTNGIPVHTDVSYFLTMLELSTDFLSVPEQRTLRGKGHPDGHQGTQPSFPKIIGITGTKGKSTTATLLHHVLNACGQKSLLAGNIRKSPLDYLRSKKIKNINLKFIILELSSWHLESLAEHKISPQIAIITNIMRDHLNRYKDFADYKRTKTLISKYQQPSNILFLNKNDAESRKIYQKKKVKSKIIWYGNKKLTDMTSLLHDNNISAVLAITKYFKLNKLKVKQAIKSFPGIDGRLQLIATIDGVKYYNDTCATQPDAAIYAITRCREQETESNKIILIAGGADKKLDYEDLAKTISTNVQTLILFKGSASNKIGKALKLYSCKTLMLYDNIIKMNDAVKLAYDNAKRNDIVLLSPAAASFGLFKHEFDRGDQFKKSVSKLK